MKETFSVETPEGTLDLTVELSPLDNTIVVSVDTLGWEDNYEAPNMGPRLRIWLNDYLMHEGVALADGAGPFRDVWEWCGDWYDGEYFIARIA